MCWRHIHSLQVDTNRSGDIGRAELFALMRSLGTHVTPAELNAMIAEVDADKDNKIGFAEFVVFLAYKVRFTAMQSLGAVQSRMLQCNRCLCIRFFGAM